MATGGEEEGGPQGRKDRAGFPSLNQRIFAPFKIATVIDTVAARGIPAEAVLDRTGLTLAEVRDPHTLTSIGQYLTACENIVAAGAEYADAFAIGSRLHLSAYGMYGYALMCSPTMRDFFDFAKELADPFTTGERLCHPWPLYFLRAPCRAAGAFRRTRDGPKPGRGNNAAERKVSAISGPLWNRPRPHATRAESATFNADTPNMLC